MNIKEIYSRSSGPFSVFRIISSVIIILSISCWSMLLSAQTSSKSVFLELGGSGFLYSVNYDMRLTQNDTGLGFRAGIGGIPDINNGDYYIAAPFQINYLFGKNGSYLELGVGATFLKVEGIDDDLEGKDLIGSMSIMFRRQPPTGGFTWRIGYTPLFANSGGLPYWIGGSVGIAF